MSPSRCVGTAGDQCAECSPALTGERLEVLQHAGVISLKLLTKKPSDVVGKVEVFEGDGIRIAQHSSAEETGGPRTHPSNGGQSAGAMLDTVRTRNRLIVDNRLKAFGVAGDGEKRCCALLIDVNAAEFRGVKAAQGLC